MRTLVSLLLCIALTTAFADEDELAGQEAKPETRIPKHTPEWTNPRTGDPGVQSVVDELQSIVVLCAKDSNSPEFKRAWTAYVRKHKLSGSGLKNTIQKVTSEAIRHRQQFGQTKGDRKDMIEWKNETSKMMHDTAMNSVRNMK